MKRYKLLIFLLGAILITSCKDDEEVLDQPTVSYYPSISAVVDEPAVGAQETVTVSLELSGTLNNISSVVIAIESEDVSYGDGFTSMPEAQNNEIIVEFSENERIASFDIILSNDVNLNPSDVINFKVVNLIGGIKSIGQGVFVLRIGDIDAGGCNNFTFGRIVREYNFDDCPEFNSPDGFTQYFIDGFKDDRGFQCRRFGEGGTPGIQASAFGGGAGEDNAWLILNEPFDLDELGNLLVQFSVESFFEGPGTIDFVYSSTYPGSGQPDQEGVSWFRMGDVRDQLPVVGSGGFVSVLSSPCVLEGSEVYFGFHFYGASSSGSSSWTIDNLTFMVDDGQTGSIGPNFDVPFSDDLNACGDFSIPANFTQVRVPGSKTDRGWYCDGNGDSGSQALKAFASGGSTGAVNAWLISAKPFDLSTASSASMLFDMKVNTSGNGTLNVMWSSNYSGSGDPTLANWTNAGAVTFPAQSTSFSEIVTDLSLATGKVAYVALQFTDATNTSSVDFNLDNIAIDDKAPQGPALISENFDSCLELNSFSQFSVIGDQIWDCTSFGQDGTTAAQISGFSGSALDNEDWMISPIFTPSAASQLIFDARTKFGGLPIKVKVSSNYPGTGDPSTSTWTDLTVGLPAMDSDVWTTVDPVSLASFADQNIYVAFIYYSNPTDGAPRWTIDNLIITE